MTDLRKLTVSLTKHGAYKVATLLKKYPKDQVLQHLRGKEPGVSIDLAQAKKTLSVTSSGVVPEVWAKAQRQGSEAVDALVLTAIIFSHHQLISAMQQSDEKSPFCGVVRRDKVIGGKAYTNLANNIEELGYSTEHSDQHVAFNLQRLFSIKGLNALALKLFELKLRSAGWNAKNSIEDECVKLHFHEVFSISENQFRDWLSLGAPGQHPLEDVEFFVSATDAPTSGTFEFRAGHNEKKTGAIDVANAKESKKASLIHNEIQNSLYALLSAEYGKECVGTEVPTGHGTSIDVVVRTEKFCWFYEIKTAASVKACIRQALPQLLEYAYWPGVAGRATRLIVVSTRAITKQADQYLAYMRKTFGIEIYYSEHMLKKKS